MSKDKKESQPKELSGFFKGYEIKWLRENPEHPDYKLVAEFDALNK